MQLPESCSLPAPLSTPPSGAALPASPPSAWELEAGDSSFPHADVPSDSPRTRDTNRPQLRQGVVTIHSADSTVGDRALATGVYGSTHSSASCGVRTTIAVLSERRREVCRFGVAD